VYTREAPVAAAAGQVRPPGRLTLADLAPAVAPGATAYVCGSARFADAASRLVVDAGVPVDAVRVERFGPTG
jgi:ferredoxin-NADP reductase